MRFFVAKCAPQNDGGFWWGEGYGGASRWIMRGAGCCGKAAAEPPHSKSSRRSGYRVGWWSNGGFAALEQRRTQVDKRPARRYRK
jgi:hypothetical protein